MHEYSVVQALLNQCEEVAEQNNATKVTKVITKIGIMSGIETHLLQTAFDTFKEGTICNEAEFVIKLQKLKLQCKDCNVEFEVDEIRYYCVECESLNVKVLDGEDMYLMSLEMN
ncbi:hydrogenase/urease nickel incorporation protein HypA [Sulfurovum sp. XGS-02]|uniref:hydrogenase/urease nickel incorporation protein HypA n=1 Tax=Sulfurovum sp. XGS-02 TaxID=2925411 RepID=UPI002064B96F|nr:hydrogenase/urease nickel incorporation protein HypA [Sulfurovum sp. XGS-02]UPT77903.1 hydrogenase/urease nickel incorporation protein HypA [Sulfurovum sp. XGS-02]